MSTINKIIAPILVVTVLLGGYYWIRTPHLSSNITLNCETPEIPDQLTKLVIIKERYDNREAYFFAKRFADFSWHSGSRDGTYRHELYSGLYNLTFYGSDMSHFEFNMPFKERYKTEILSEAQCIDKADQLIEEITDYFNSSLEYWVANVEKIKPEWELVATVGGNRSYYYYRIYYDIYYEGVELLGKGTDAWVEVCDKEILGYRLHFPVLEERGIDKVYLTPIEALNRLESGCIVYDIEFGYYTDFEASDNYSVVEYGYLVNGGINRDFSGKCLGLFIPTMAGNAYRWIKSSWI